MTVDPLGDPARSGGQPIPDASHRRNGFKNGGPVLDQGGNTPSQRAIGGKADIQRSRPFHLALHRRRVQRLDIIGQSEDGADGQTRALGDLLGRWRWQPFANQVEHCVHGTIEGLGATQIPAIGFSWPVSDLERPPITVFRRHDSKANELAYLLSIGSSPGHKPTEVFFNAFRQ